MKKYHSVIGLKKAVLVALEKGEINSSLSLISDFVEFIVSEPLCIAQVFASKTLDDLCLYIGKKSLADVMALRTDASIEADGSRCFVYIVTKLQKSGGHTRVIEEFIAARPDEKHIILSTELAGKSDSNYLRDGLGRHVSISFERAPKVEGQRRLAWLQRRLLELQPTKTYLFNRDHDSIAVAAIQPEMKLDASFYHHSDYHLCLGVHLSHLEHIDFHPVGYHNCRAELGVDNIYIPLSADDKGMRPSHWLFAQGGEITTCTAGRYNKIEVPYFISYLDMVPQILQATKGRHVHIGLLSPWALIKIRRGLKRRGIAKERFIYTPWVPSVWRALHDYRVDLYIVSFPYGGGLTLVEVMGAGVPVAMHRHIYYKLLNCVDMAYAGAFSWSSPSELLDYCSSLTPWQLESESKLSRLQYEQHHTTGGLRAVLDGKVVDAPPCSRDFSVQIDEWGLWMARRVTLTAVLSKVIYRLAKRFKRLF